MTLLNQNLYRAFDLFELTPANEIAFLDSYKKTLSKCCIDPLRPPSLSECGFAVRCSCATVEIGPGSQGGPCDPSDRN